LPAPAAHSTLETRDALLAVTALGDAGNPPAAMTGDDDECVAVEDLLLARFEDR
jgi:hypothetical protein